MSTRAALSLFLCSLALLAGCAGDSGAGPGVGVSDEDVCANIAPKPADVTQFHEDNPTYTAAAMDAEVWTTDTPESQGMRSAPLLAGAKALAALPQPFSFLVLRHGVLVFERYFNGSGVASSNNIHSASKSMISALVGIAIREGFVKSVDQKVADILPARFSFPSNKKTITVRHLLTMSAGLDWTEDVSESLIEKKANWVQAILDLGVKQKPGTTFNYSSALTHTLSAILTESSGMGTCAFATKYLFRPMGISVEHWGRDPQGYYSGGYNVYLAARQLLKLGQMYLQKGMWNGVSILPPAWIDEAVKPSQKVDSTYSYGYLFWLLTLGGHPVYEMWGYGGQYVYIVPSLDLVFVTTADTKDEHTELDAAAFFSTYLLPAIAK